MLCRSYHSQYSSPAARSTSSSTPPRASSIPVTEQNHKFRTRRSLGRLRKSCRSRQLFIAEPLFDALVANGLKIFLDKRELHPGQNAPQKMDGAMERARIAVVILSPQFAGRPCTMKELLCFLRCFRSAGERGVIIIPVFYRLTLEDCRNALMVTDGDGNKVLMTEEFLQRMAWNSEYGIADVVQGLREMRELQVLRILKMQQTKTETRLRRSGRRLSEGL